MTEATPAANSAPQEGSPGTHSYQPASKRKVTLVVVACAVVFAVLYVAGIVGFKATDGSFTVEGTPTEHADGITVIAIPTGLEPATNQLSTRLLIEPTGTFADENGDPAEPITLLVNSYSGSAAIEIPKGKPVAAQEIKIFADGRWSQYPLDSYSGTLYLLATTPSAEGSSAVPVTLEGEAGLEGWSLNVQLPPQGQSTPVAEANFTLSRPPVTVAFVGLTLVLFVLIAILAVSVAIAVGARRRRIEPQLLGWGAALLFALPALRNALPGAPPIGAWVDVLAFLWVIVVAIASYLVVVVTWLRNSPPPT